MQKMLFELSEYYPLLSFIRFNYFRVLLLISMYFRQATESKTFNLSRKVGEGEKKDVVSCG